MSRNTISYGLLIIGILVLAGSLAADLLGLGSSPGGIGWKQWLGAGIGFIITAVGVYLYLQSKESKK
jgi:hypothetical protein